MSDDLTITKRDAELIAEIVVIKIRKVLQEQISNVIEEELSPLLEEMVQSIASSYKSLNEIQNFMSFINRQSSRTAQKQDQIQEDARPQESRGTRKKGFKKFLETGDTLGDQYAHAPNRHPRPTENLREETTSRYESPEWGSDDEDGDSDEIESMFSINERLVEEEEAVRRKMEAQERFNRMHRPTNEEQPKNTEHDHGAEGGFVEDFLKENAPAYAQGSRSRKRSPMGPVAPEREEDLMDEVIDEDVRRMMEEEAQNPSPMSSFDSFDSTASYDEFFIPPDVNVAGVSMPNMSHAQRPQSPPVRGENVGFRDGGGYDEIPPPEIA